MEIKKDGKRFKIVPVEKRDKISNLAKRSNFIKGDPNDIVNINWETVKEKLEPIECSRLAKECSKLDPVFEKAMAEEGLSEDLSEWSKY